MLFFQDLFFFWKEELLLIRLSCLLRKQIWKYPIHVGWQQNIVPDKVNQDMFYRREYWTVHPEYDIRGNLWMFWYTHLEALLYDRILILFFYQLVDAPELLSGNFTGFKKDFPKPFLNYVCSCKKNIPFFKIDLFLKIFISDGNNSRESFRNNFSKAQRYRRISNWRQFSSLAYDFYYIKQMMSNL